MIDLWDMLYKIMLNVTRNIIRKRTGLNISTTSTKLNKRQPTYISKLKDDELLHLWNVLLRCPT